MRASEINTQTLGYNRYVHRLDADVGELPFLKKKNYCWHVSQQPNGYNCGAFAMYNTCRFIRRPPLVFQEEDCSKEGAKKAQKLQLIRLSTSLNIKKDFTRRRMLAAGINLGTKENN